MPPSFNAQSILRFVVTLIATRSRRSSRDDGVEQVEANSRNNEQVHGDDVRRVITQKGTPSLGWWSTSRDHVLGDAGRATSKPSLSTSPWIAALAKAILHADPPDQRPEVRVDLRPASQ